MNIWHRHVTLKAVYLGVFLYFIYVDWFQMKASHKLMAGTSDNMFSVKTAPVQNMIYQWCLIYYRVYLGHGGWGYLKDDVWVTVHWLPWYVSRIPVMNSFNQIRYYIQHLVIFIQSGQIKLVLNFRWWKSKSVCAAFPIINKTRLTVVWFLNIDYRT